MDLLTGGYGTSMEEALDNFPPYQDLVKILRGTATETDVEDFLTHLTNYMGEYDDYGDLSGTDVEIAEEEFGIIKENLPKLFKALSPIIIADAEYTQNTFGEDYSLYYTYSLVDNAAKLVIGHIPESIMPILKSLIPEEEIVIPKAPNTGQITVSHEAQALAIYTPAIIVAAVLVVMVKLRAIYTIFMRSIKMVVPAGLEPATQGSSGLCSTN